MCPGRDGYKQRCLRFNRRSRYSGSVSRALQWPAGLVPATGNHFDLMPFGWLDNRIWALGTSVGNGLANLFLRQIDPQLKTMHQTGNFPVFSECRMPLPGGHPLNIAGADHAFMSGIVFMAHLTSQHI